jgi:hypothetical protein
LYVPSADTFEWDPVPGAASYQAVVLTVPRPGQPPLQVIEKRLTQPRFSPGLGVSTPGTQYMFRVEAYNEANKHIGTFNDYYIDGSGGWLLFTVIPPPQSPASSRPPSSTPPSPANDAVAAMQWIESKCRAGIELVVPTPAGSTSDAAARSFASALGRFGVRPIPVTVNRPAFTADGRFSVQKFDEWQRSVVRQSDACSR